MKIFKKIIIKFVEYCGFKEALQLGYLGFKQGKERYKRRKIQLKQFYKDVYFLKKNLFLKENGKNKRAFLLATGPSIKQEDLSRLKGEDCFSVSNFFLHSDIDIISPKIHFFMPYHEPLILENYIAWLQRADRKLPISTDVFLGIQTKKIVDEYRLFSKRSVHYLYFKDDLSKKDDIDILAPLLTPQTVPIMALYVLLYMGYREIYLLGCDHDVLRYYKQDVKHFYNKEDEVRIGASDKTTWVDNIKVALRSLNNVFVQYDMLAKIAKDRNNFIVNLSAKSWLDTFPKDNLKDILKKQVIYTEKEEHKDKKE